MPSSKSLRDNVNGDEVDLLFALVLWLNGVHAGTMTPNLNVDWIRDFDPDHVDSSESYTVEWRRPPKPKAGWPLYDCKVIEVSRDRDFLKSRMRELPSCTNENDSVNETPTTSRRSSQSDSQCLRDILNSFRDSINSGDPQGRRINGSNSSLSFSSTSDSSQNVTKVGSALVVSNTAYILAKAAASPSAMTMLLVRAAFSKRRLRRSSYAGQKRNGLCKPGLKRYRKMQDIQDFVKTRFPYVTQASFGAAVNNCLGKNVDKERVREFVDESDSDEDFP